MKKYTKLKKGFTLIEILLVIASIGILATIVLVAINPNEQISKVRTTGVKNNANSLYKAIEQYNIDKGGTYENLNLDNTPKELCNTGKETTGSNTNIVCQDKVDLRPLVPDYIAEIPNSDSTYTYKLGINKNNNRVGVNVVSGNSLIQNLSVNTVLPEINISLNPTSVVEDGAANLEYKFTRIGDQTQGITINYTIGGTATNGVDYDSISSTVNLPANQTEVTVIVNPVSDNTVEDNETVIISIASSTEYNIGASSSVTGTISNDDIASGDQVYTTPGTYTFTVPAGVTSISAVVVGGGGAGACSYNTNVRQSGGGGGALRYINNLTVTPGENITVTVGAAGIINGCGGQNGGGAGGQSRIVQNGNTVLFANGGSYASYDFGDYITLDEGGGGSGSTIGGNIGGQNGANGGRHVGSTNGGGGGGAGGYSARTNQFAGWGYGSASTGTANAPGNGGGGAGGGYGQGGGGVGLYGEGLSGANPGQGGSSGTNGTSATGARLGGNFGGGGGGSNSGFDSAGAGAVSGGPGGARIIWGQNRTFPNNAQ